MILQQAVIPEIGIETAIDHWERIKERLKENNRKRQLQIDYLKPFI